jgi:hypothetical protein
MSNINNKKIIVYKNWFNYYNKKNYKENIAINYNNDLLNKYMHSIRNMIYLNSEMINNIKNMSDENKMEIIILFNEVVDRLKILIDNI